MKELSLYQCEYCKTSYANKSDCAECEKNHKTTARIKEKRYLPYKKDRCGYPIELNVEFADGKVIKYKRS